MVSVRYSKRKFFQKTHEIRNQQHKKHLRVKSIKSEKKTFKLKIAALYSVDRLYSILDTSTYFSYMIKTK